MQDRLPPDDEPLATQAGPYMGSKTEVAACGGMSVPGERTSSGWEAPGLRRCSSFHRASDMRRTRNDGRLGHAPRISSDICFPIPM